MTQETQQTFVFEGTEVVKTGRTATRKLGTSVAKLIEIKPADPNVPTWKKWVAERDLYQVDQ